MLNFVIKAALMVASTALTMSKRIEGPRLNDLKFTSGDYGSPLENVWGKRRGEKPIFFAEDLKEVKQTRKTKGGKFNDYTYYGTWAVALAGHEIAGVTRIWLDANLAFDLTGAGPITPFDLGPAASGGKGGGAAGVGGHLINDHMTIYYGTETQEQDPRILATTEAKHGEGSCPAYRGTAYIVFKDLPLEKFGNRIPQVSVEVVSAITGIVPTEQRDYTLAPNSAFNLTFSADFSRVAWMVGDVPSVPGGFEVWDVAARAQMLSTGLPIGYTVDAASHFGVYNNGDLLAYKYDGATLNRITPDGAIALVQYDATVNRQQFGCRVVADGKGVEHWGTYPYSFYQRWFFDGVLYEPGYQACLYFADSYGNVWVVGREVAAGSTTNLAYFKRLVTVDNTPGYLSEFVVTMPDAAGPGGQGEGVYACASGDNFVCDWENKLHLINPVTGAIVSSHTATARGAIYSQKTVWNNIVPGTGRIWLGNSEYELSTGELIRTVSGVPASSGGYRSVYDPINHALILAEDDLTWYFVDRITGQGVTLGSIASDVADMVGVTAYDFSALDQVVPGWSATRGQASNMLDPLFDAYDSDIRPHDFTLQGIKRSGVSGGTLHTTAFAVKDKGVRYTVKVQQAVELPVATIINFADINADQQPNSVRADRPLDATDARGEKAIDLTTLALTPDAARQLADRHFRRIWNERKGVSNSLTAQELKLEPGDCRTLELDGETGVYRCVKVTVRADDVLQTEWKYDHPGLATITASTGAAFDGRDASVIVVPLLSKGFVLDVPLLTDADGNSNPLIYIAAAPCASGAWPGATVYEAVGGEYSHETGAVASSSPATWGYATGVLGDANPNVWDRGHSVNVKLQNGTLTGTTEAAIDTNPSANLALIGDEIVNFTTATLETDGSYTLSGFKRGRRGTEWACATHAARDVFLLLNTAEGEHLGLSEVGTDLSFKAITSGRTESGAFPITMAPFSGASLKPYAPCQLKAVKDSGTGDWTLTWVRRTRVGGAWTSGTAIPLSETTEAYVVEIMNGSTVVRTITGLTSPTTVWTAANQTSDFGSGQSAVSYRVYQVSDAVGRGFRAAATA